VGVDRLPCRLRQAFLSDRHRTDINFRSLTLFQGPRRVGELLAKYPEMDVGAATLVVLSELYPRAKLITVDDDFRRYRRQRNQVIPLVIPE
jgi:hypothetical protein